MQEKVVDILEIATAKVTTIVCVTTNGATNARGDAVMGTGVARDLAIQHPELPMQLGTMIKRNGNVVNLLKELDHGRVLIYSFPVKPANRRCRHRSELVANFEKWRKFQVGDYYPGWMFVADLELIGRSCDQLVAAVAEHGAREVYLPRPGCGAGERSYLEDVKPILEAKLHDTDTTTYFICAEDASEFGALN